MHVDLPTRSEILGLMEVEGRVCVTIQQPTSPLPTDVEADRIGFGNLASQALDALAEVDGADVAEFSALLDDLADDRALWSHRANTLVVYATADQIRTYHLPNRLEPAVVVGDRFFLKPLVRSVTFPSACFVLALAQGSVRLLEVSPEVGAFEVPVADLPTDIASAVGKSAITDRSPTGRIQGDEGQKVRMRQYARQVDRALREVLRGQELPLILAAAAPLDQIFRSVNSYAGLVPEGIVGNPETTNQADLVAAARAVLDGRRAAEVQALGSLFEQRASHRRVASDLADIARAATYGMVDTLLFDIDQVVTGTVDPETGALEYTGADVPGTYDLVDTIGRAVVRAGGRLVAVRADEVPRGGPAAAILRYA